MDDLLFLLRPPSLIDHSTSHEMFSLAFALKLGWQFTQLPNFLASARRFAEGHVYWFQLVYNCAN